MTRKTTLAAGAAALALAAIAPPAFAAQDDLTLISHAFDAPLVRADGYSGQPAISADGRYVAYTSVATNLVPGDLNGVADVFRTDRVTGQTVLVSRAGGLDGALGDQASGDAISGGVDISADGRHVAFISGANNLASGEDETAVNLFVRDVDGGQTVLVHRRDDDAPATGGNVDRDFSISDDGNRVAFSTTATDMLPGNPTKDDVVVRDIAAGTTTLVSAAGDTDIPASEHSWNASMTGDGRRVAFVTQAPELGLPGYSSLVVVRDLATKSVTVVGVGLDGAPMVSTDPAISRDGTKVGFEDGGYHRVYLRDLSAGTTEIATRADGPAGDISGDAEFVTDYALSRDGRFVAFASDSPAISPIDGPGSNAFVRDLASDRTYLVSRAAGADGAPDDGEDGYGIDIDGDGRFVAFDSDAKNLSDLDYVDDAAPSDLDVFLRQVAPDPAPISGPADLEAPIVRAASVAPKRFRVAKAPTAVSAAKTRGVKRRAKRGKTPSGAAIRFTLSEQTTARIAISRELSGLRARRRGKAACVTPTKRNRAAARKAIVKRPAIIRLEGARKLRAIGKAERKLRCKRYEERGVLTRRDLASGRESVPFTGRIGAKKLKPGAYRVQIAATDAAGNRSKSRAEARFQIVE